MNIIKNKLLHVTYFLLPYAKLINYMKGSVNMPIIKIKYSVTQTQKADLNAFTIQTADHSTSRFAAENAVLDVATLLGVSNEALLNHLLSLDTSKKMLKHSRELKEANKCLN